MQYVSSLNAAAYLMPDVRTLMAVPFFVEWKFLTFFVQVTLGSSIMKSTPSMTVLADRPIYEIKAIGRRQHEKCST